MYTWSILLYVIIVLYIPPKNMLSRILFSRKSASTGTPIINFCFRDFNFREWYQDLRNLNPTKIMPYTVIKRYCVCVISLTVASIPS